MAAAPSIKSARPTNREIAEGVNAAHECIHNVGDRVDQLTRDVQASSDQISTLTQESRENRQGLASALLGIEGRMGRMEGALGVKLSSAESNGDAPPPKPAKKFAGLSQWQAVATIASSMFGALAAYKVIEPAIVAAATALHQALMGAPPG